MKYKLNFFQHQQYLIRPYMESILCEKKQFIHKRIFCTDFIQILGYSEPSTGNNSRLITRQIMIIVHYILLDLQQRGPNRENVSIHLFAVTATSSNKIQIRLIHYGTSQS